MKTTMTTLVIGVMLGLGTTVPVGDAEAAAGRPGKGIEGTWRVQITLRDCDTWAPLAPPFPALASFNGGGTVVTSDGGMSPGARGSGHGVWQRLGRGHYAATTEAFLFNAGMRSGTQRLVQEIALDHRGQSFESSVGAAVLNLEGQVVFSGCASSVGQRLQ